MSQSGSDFTMVFLDLDNTLIPTRMRKIMDTNFGINIFHTLSSTLLKKLQYSIIKALDKITSTLERQNTIPIIKIVSNANGQWINQLLKYTQDGPAPTFPILSKYLHHNDIAMHSAADEMYEFLHNKYGEINATAASSFLDATAGDSKRRWVWKYTTFNSILLKYKRKWKGNCAQIISFGDGTDEARALSKYSNEYGVKCNHINFIAAPSINQLHQQWAYVIDHIDALIMNNTKDDNESPYILYSLNSLFKCDNNKHGTGKDEQLKAIATYLQLWINNLDDVENPDHKADNINALCRLVHLRLHCEKKVKHTRKIVQYLLNNDVEFNAALTNYCKKY